MLINPANPGGIVLNAMEGVEVRLELLKLSLLAVLVHEKRFHMAIPNELLPSWDCSLCPRRSADLNALSSPVKQ